MEKGKRIIYVDVAGKEHDALVTALNSMHPGFASIAYVDESAPERDNIKRVYDVPRIGFRVKIETNPSLPDIHLNVLKDEGEIHNAPAPDHPIFDSLYEEKQKDEFGKPLVKERPEYEAQVAAHQESVAGLPSGADLDAVVETKQYSDGSSATGVAPLPDLSPEQQQAGGPDIGGGQIPSDSQ